MNNKTDFSPSEEDLDNDHNSPTSSMSEKVSAYMTSKQTIVGLSDLAVVSEDLEEANEES